METGMPGTGSRVIKVDVDDMDDITQTGAQQHDHGRSTRSTASYGGSGEVRTCSGMTC
jgi:hypothetical protein